MPIAHWKEASYFESTDYVIEFSKRRIGRTYSREKANEISLAYRQGRNYFEQASLSEYTIKPLLIYYGALSLSRALMLVIDPMKREASLSSTHGLKWISHTHYSKGNAVNMLGLQLKITQGTFLELIICTKNTNLLLSNTTTPQSHFLFK